MSYEQGDKGVHSPGHNCRHCGHAGFEHERERVTTENGRYRYELKCPT